MPAIFDLKKIGSRSRRYPLSRRHDTDTHKADPRLPNCFPPSLSLSLSLSLSPFTRSSGSSDNRKLLSLVVLVYQFDIGGVGIFPLIECLTIFNSFCKR